MINYTIVYLIAFRRFLCSHGIPQCFYRHYLQRSTLPWLLIPADLGEQASRPAVNAHTPSEWHREAVTQHPPST